MDSNKIKAALIFILALFGAVWLGISIVTDQTETILKVVVAMVFIGCLLMGRRVWLLIPFMGTLDLGLRIPGQPSTLMLGQLLVLGFCTALFLIRRLPYRIRLTELEFWVLILSVFVAQAYIRNPVGLNLFGGASVGGKPYFLYAISVSTMIIFSAILVTEKDLKLFFKATVLGGLMNAAVSITGRFIPAVGFYFGGDYVRSDEVNYEDFGKAVDTGATNRINFLGPMTKNISLWLSCFISPLRACFHPLWVFVLLFCVGAAAYSGYRNVVVAVGLTLLVGIAYRGGFFSVFLSVLGGVCFVALLAVVNLILPLPPNVQRSLTFLPGTWEERYSGDAKSSSDWRFEIWREVLTSDRYIQNKWIGDGLGFSSEALRQNMSDTQNRAGRSGFDEHREGILISGDYHSGPVQTIRVIGYIGLLFMLLAMWRLAVHAHRQILRCRGTEWYPLSLLIGIPLIVHPIFFTFVFGDFRGGSTTFLIGVGMIRFLQNNLPLPEYVVRRHTPYVLQRPDQRSAGEQAAPQGALR